LDGEVKECRRMGNGGWEVEEGGLQTNGKWRGEVYKRMGSGVMRFTKEWEVGGGEGQREQKNGKWGWPEGGK
jgi:hypothetical protein